MFQVSTPIPSSPASVGEDARTPRMFIWVFGRASHVEHCPLTPPGEGFSARHLLPSRLRAPHLPGSPLGVTFLSLGSVPLMSIITAPPSDAVTEAAGSADPGDSYSLLQRPRGPRSPGRALVLNTSSLCHTGVSTCWAVCPSFQQGANQWQASLTCGA